MTKVEKPGITMSVRLAAPVARHGLPKNPCRKRMMRNPAKLSVNAAPTQRRLKIANVMM
jgi:hypothetical protein